MRKLIAGAGMRLAIGVAAVTMAATAAIALETAAVPAVASAATGTTAPAVTKAIHPARCSGRTFNVTYGARGPIREKCYAGVGGPIFPEIPNVRTISTGVNTGEFTVTGCGSVKNAFFGPHELFRFVTGCHVTLRSLRIIRTAAAAPAVTTAALVRGVSQAQAPQAGSGSGTVEAVYTGKAQRPGRIVCHIGVSTPHFFLPSDRSVGSAAFVHCSSKVAGIAFALVMTRDGTPVAHRSGQSLGSRIAAGFVSYRCPIGRAHTYITGMAGTVVFPPGYEPQSKSFALASPPARVRCHG
jgi:hypothetical protein